METNHDTTTLKFETRERVYSDRGKRHIIFVDAPADFLPEEPTEKCTDLECGSPWCENARRSGHPEHCEVDHKAWRKFHREVVAMKKAWALEALGNPEGVKLSWSSKAGCSMCPCSPGLIVTEGRGLFRRDMATYIDVSR